MAEINRIKSTKTTAATLPEPPKLSPFIKSGVLKVAEAQEFDIALKQWFERLQHILKTQWFQT